jgi:hypothetical protein
MGWVLIAALRVPQVRRGYRPGRSLANTLLIQLSLGVAAAVTRNLIVSCAFFVSTLGPLLVIVVGAGRAVIRSRY